MKNLIKKYNKPDSVLVISSYPERGVKYSGKVCAVGGFAKNTIQSLKTQFQKKNEKRQFIVLTVIIGKEEIYEENGILVIRIFRRNNPFSYLKLLKLLSKFNRVKDVLIEFEFASFGNLKTTAFFPVIPFYLYLLRKRINLVLHQVVLDLSGLSGHLGWSKKDLKVKFFNFFLRLFFFFLCLTPKKIVVLEEILKNRLGKAIGMTKKIVVIPHGVDQKIRPMSSDSAREKLKIKKHEFVLLYFGYLTWYKGADLLIKSLAKQKTIAGRNIRLILAGGPSFTQKEKPQYQIFLKKVLKIVESSSHITLTGFIPEKDFPLYFGAADLVILPYRAFISSSGPLSLSLSFKKPLLFSSSLKEYTFSRDFQLALKESNLKENNLFFFFKNNGLIRKIEFLLKKRKMKNLARFSQNLGQKRDFNILASQYGQLLELSSFKPVITRSSVKQNDLAIPVKIKIASLSSKGTSYTVAARSQ